MIRHIFAHVGDNYERNELFKAENPMFIVIAAENSISLAWSFSIRLLPLTHMSEMNWVIGLATFEQGQNG